MSQPDRLQAILRLLPGRWSVEDLQEAGMGWAAVLTDGRGCFTLHSERGWVDVWGRYLEQQCVGCAQGAEEIAAIIASRLQRVGAD
ncbi:hypothetical protein H1235_04730 [Pseudoxanthomonas sp. NC8]|nr:hypothetical protein H1235_04730 [Pseudoxanthomonas sp. NC8]